LIVCVLSGLSSSVVVGIDLKKDYKNL